MFVTVVDSTGFRNEFSRRPSIVASANSYDFMTLALLAAQSCQSAKCRRTHPTLTVATTYFLVLCILRFLV